MSRIATFILLTLISVLALFGAETSWTKVTDLKGHAELRIWKKGAAQPINATFADATDERVIVVIKNDQVAIEKDDIDRIDARPLSPPRKATVTKSEKQSDPDYTPGRPQSGPPLPQTSSSSNVSFGNKPDFETIYRRAEGAPKK